MTNTISTRRGLGAGRPLNFAGHLYDVDPATGATIPGAGPALIFEDGTFVDEEREQLSRWAEATRGSLADRCEAEAAAVVNAAMRLRLGVIA